MNDTRVIFHVDVNPVMRVRGTGLFLQSLCLLKSMA